MARTSEPGGYFDSDNIITNEGSYLQVASQLARVHTHGGVYIGVGPDQNFSYVALVRPAIAFMIDIRRDNLLEHLLFKSLFAVVAQSTGVSLPPAGQACPGGCRQMDEPAGQPDPGVSGVHSIRLTGRKQDSQGEQ